MFVPIELGSSSAATGWRGLLKPALLMVIIALVMAVLLPALAEGGLPALARVVMIALVLGYALAAGAVAAYVRLPRVTGWLLAGAAIGPSAWTLASGSPQVIPEGWSPILAPATDLAVGVIALIAGSEIDHRWLHERWRSVVAIVGRIGLAVGTAVMAAVWLMPGLSLRDDALLQQMPVWLLALVVAVVLLPNGPTVVIGVIRDLAARGPLTRMLVGCSFGLDALVIVLFSIVLPLAQRVSGTASTQLALSIAGVLGGLIASLAVGLGIGLLLRALFERTATGGWLLVLGLTAGVGAGGPLIGLKPLFCLCAAGYAATNIGGGSPERQLRLRQSLTQVALPVFGLFFCSAGIALDLRLLASAWLPALVLLIARDVPMWLATGRCASLSGCEPAVQRNLWIGMVSQAGVTLALVQQVAQAFPGWGAHLAAIVIAMVAVHEVWVPVALAWALRRSGEAGQADSLDPAPAPVRHPV